jgi:glycosyltransferase involved in cell wall biosynthesis
MRIGVVVPYYKPASIYGGPVRSVSALCEGLSQAGAQVAVFTTNANGAEALTVPTGQPVNVDGVQVYYHPRLGSRLLSSYFYSPSLRLACRGNIRKQDVVYICGTWTYAMVAGATAALKAGIPFVVSPRGSFMTWSMSQKPFKKRAYLALVERRLMNGAAAIHCTSSLEQQQLSTWSFRPPSVVFPNGLDLAPFGQLPERGKLRRALSVPPAGTLSLFVGRMHKMKRLDLMIETFARVAQTLPNAHLLIVGPEGDGSGKKAQKQVQELGLSQLVHFAGLLTGMDLLQAYADADLQVLLSHRENFAMAVVEAMAAGLPVLVTEPVGLAEEVARAGAGYCVAADKEKIAAAWAELLFSPELRQEMGRKGGDLARRQFASEVVAAQMFKFLSSLPASKR